MESTQGARVLLDADAVEEALSRLAREIRAGGSHEDLMLIGIRRRGAELAERLTGLLEEACGAAIPSGALDITLYRDDFAQIGPWPVVGVTEVPEEITGRRVVIVDDVLFTGRTIRAALNELADFGRPRRIELAVLVDRGGRELPIQPDYAGMRTTVAPGEHVAVHVPEIDGELSVRLLSGKDKK